MKLSCLIVDDEPLARKVLENYIAELPHLQLIASCSNAIEATEILHQDTVDLIFLDINLPKLSGIHFLRSLSAPPLVIFVTAYPEHAVEGFELEAIDYLLKPFSYERFLKAINRALRVEKSTSPSPMANKTEAYLLVKSNKKWYRIKMDQIDYLQAYGDYVKIFTDSEMHLVKEKLGVLEARLSPDRFFRIHRSYIIRLDAISYIEGRQIRLKETLLPVSASLKEELLTRLGKKKD